MKIRNLKKAGLYFDEKAERKKIDAEWKICELRSPRPITMPSSAASDAGSGQPGSQGQAHTGEIQATSDMEQHQRSENGRHAGTDHHQGVLHTTE